MAREKPTFITAHDQIMWFIGEYALFCADVMREAGRKDVPSDDWIIDSINGYGAIVVISHVLNARDMFGKEIDKRDMSAVSRLVAYYSPSLSPNGLAEDITLFTSFLENNVEKKALFFKHWDRINRVIDGVNKK